MKAKNWMVFLFVLLSLFVSVGAFAQDAAEETAATETEAAAADEGSSMRMLGALIGAAVAFGLGAIGAGLGIGQVGSAAMGAIAEKPNLAGQALIFVALAEGIVVFGFIMAIMILGKRSWDSIWREWKAGSSPEKKRLKPHSPTH